MPIRSARRCSPRLGPARQAGASKDRTIAAGEGWRVGDIVCTRGPSDRPFEERQSGASISLVLSGTFVCRSEQGASLLAAGSVMLVSAGQTFECSHSHGEGDRCLSFQFDPDLFERLAHDAGASRAAFERQTLPPLRPLARVASRARAAMANPAVLEEIAVELVGAVIAVAGRSPRATGHDPAPRPHRPRAAAADVSQRRAAFARRSGAQRRPQPLSFPAHLQARHRHHAAPVAAADAPARSGAAAQHHPPIRDGHRPRRRLRGLVQLHAQLPRRVRRLAPPLSASLRELGFLSP